MITWTYKGKEYWESYCYYPYRGISVSIRAYTNGKYMILNNGQIILSGNKINREEAIKALNDYLYPVLHVIEEKDTGVPLSEEEVIDTQEVTEKDEDAFEIRHTVTPSPTEEGCVVISLKPKGTMFEGSVIKYTTNGKAVISSSKIYKGEFVVEKGTPINYAVFDANKNKFDEGNFIGE